MKITVYKLDEKGHEVWHYPARVLGRGERWIRLEAFFDRPRADLGPVVFEEGDRFVETFYSDRWYNVFAVYEGEGGSFKGWYCNICRPAEITQSAVRCEDLALDVWVSPEREISILDEEEFKELNISSEERSAVQGALEHILRAATEKRLPR
ncbi:MAG: DUF402 domain-containing protein [Chloroflexota bacterium]